MDNLSAKLIYNLENFFYSPLLQFCRKKVINLGERVIRLIKIYLVWEKERLILLYLENFFIPPYFNFVEKKVINLGERVIRLIKIYLVWEKERLILLYLDLKKF